MRKGEKGFLPQWNVWMVDRRHAFVMPRDRLEGKAGARGKENMLLAGRVVLGVVSRVVVEAFDQVSATRKWRVGGLLVAPLLATSRKVLLLHKIPALTAINECVILRIA